MPAATNVSIVSWNCLADAYAQGTTVGKQKNCQHLVAWPYRWQKISSILQQRNADIVCLQEVDHYETHFKSFLEKLEYSVFYVQRPGREDGVLIAFKTCKFHLLREERIYFDDLADVKSLYLPIAVRDSLRRKNVALTLVLRSSTIVMGSEMIHRDSFSVSTTHLYWNPAAPHIKLAQAVYLIRRIANIHSSFARPLVASILTGDFNSLPNSDTYMRVLSGVSFSASAIAPTADASHEACKLLAINHREGERVKFLCDSTLTRMMRWLRMLGVDVMLEDSYSQERRSKHNDYSMIFERARTERRVIVTTSTNMLRRSMRPEAFIVRPSCNSLEREVSKLLNFYNVKLSKSDILSICGKCGGKIETCTTEDPRVKGKAIPLDRQLYMCIKCFQPYWNGDSESAVSAKAFRTAQGLLAYIEADRKKKSPDEHLKCPASPAKILERGIDSPTSTVSHRTPSISFTNENTDWLRYHSAFQRVKKHEPLYTNVNGAFQGTLDYIFVGGACVVVACEVKRTFLRKKTKRAFPNADWPSDHMLIWAALVIPHSPAGRSPFSRSSSMPSLNKQECF